MNWKVERTAFSADRHICKKNGFMFSCTNIDGWYIVTSHNKKDIRFNTLWQDIEFKDLEECKQWCEDFNYKNFNCLGDAAKRN